MLSGLRLPTIPICLVLISVLSSLVVLIRILSPGTWFSSVKRPEWNKGRRSDEFHFRENLEQKFAQYGKLETVTLINPLSIAGKSDVLSEEHAQEKYEHVSETSDSAIQTPSEESGEKTAIDNSTKPKKPTSA